MQDPVTGVQAYQSYSDIKGGSVAKAEAGIGFSTSKNQQSNSYATSQPNQISAGGNVNLTSTAGDIHLQNTQVKAKETISLGSAKNILLESGQSQEKAQGKNSNAGLSVGVGASVGAQTGAYIYAEAGYGKGSNQLDRNTHSQTTLEANKVSLTSKGDTTLAGAKATANRIDADVGGKLSIISQQDQVEQKIEQSGAGARLQASLGTAWQASGNLSNSSANGSSNSVNQQAGLFAGDGGYHVKADQVDLKGGAIVSTAKKENNDLTANRLTFSDINNKSSYDATSVSLSGGTRFGEETKTDNQGNKYTNNVNWRDSTTFSPSLPQHESDKDSSVTRSTLSEGNITIGGQATTTTALGIHSDASTAHRSVDTLPNLQEIIDKQKTVADATSTIVAATRTYSQNQQKQAEQEKKNTEQTAIAELQAKGGEDWNKYQNSNNEAEKQELLKNNSPSYKQASETAQDWGMGGDKTRAVNAVTMAVTGALGGQTDLQVAANALAPYAANIIGKELGHGEDKNKAAQLAAHAILGAALAYVNGGNPAAGGSAAVASEAAADYLTNQYKDKKEYQDVNGEFQPNLLPEDVKTQIRDLTAAIGAVVGGTVGDSAFNAQLAGVVGQNAVENNLYAILTPDGKKYDGKKNTEYLEALRSCSHAQCVNMVLTNNAKDAMKTAPEILILNGSNYKEGEIIGAGLQYLVVKENGVLKAKLLPLNYQVINSIKDLDSSRALAQGGALTAPLANLVKGLHDSTTGQSILTNEQLSMVDRAFAAMDAAGSFGMITGAFLPKGVKTTGSSKTIEENNIYRDSDSWSNKPSGKQEYDPIFERLSKQIDTTIAQSQRKHTLGDSQHDHGSYFNNVQDAQKVLDAFHKGNTSIVGYNKQGQPIVKYNDVNGVYSTINKVGDKFESSTNYFLIKGTKKVSIVPYSPKGPK